MAESNDDFIDSTELVSRVLESFLPEKAEEIGRGNKILSSWRAILESIKSQPIDGEPADQMGKNLASHSRIIDIKNGILLVEADHSAWLQILQLHKKFILGSLQRRFPELQISTLAFRVRGSKASLSDFPINYEASLKAERARQAQRYEAEKKYLASLGFAEPDTTKIPELPQKLKDLFDKMKRDMLTNERKI